MRWIDADARPIDPAWLVGRLRDGHRDGVDALGRCHLAEPRPGAGEGAGENGFLVWPAWRFGAALGAKLVSIFPGNEAAGAGPTNHTVYVLFDGTSGAPRAVITGAAFTRHKTAADSALAAGFLARDNARRLAVLGAGAQAETQIDYLRAVCPSLAHVAIWNRTPARASALARALQDRGIAAEASDDREPIVRAADIVTCLTSATAPILRGAWLSPGTHVDLVGGFTPAMRESDDAAIRAARVFCDHRALVLANNGDLADPIARGVVTPAHVLGDLFDLCRGTVGGRRDPAEITLFKNGGGGHLDLMVARALAG